MFIKPGAHALYSKFSLSIFSQMFLAISSGDFFNVLDNEKEVLKEQAMNEGKPADIAEKMVAGRIQKFYKEICLAEQAFIKDPSKKVLDIVNETVAKIGEKISVRRFVRYEMGEGLEKRNDDFASEVMSQMNKQ